MFLSIGHTINVISTIMQIISKQSSMFYSHQLQIFHPTDSPEFNGYSRFARITRFTLITRFARITSFTRSHQICQIHQEINRFIRITHFLKNPPLLLENLHSLVRSRMPPSTYTSTITQTPWIYSGIFSSTRMLALRYIDVVESPVFGVIIGLKA